MGFGLLLLVIFGVLGPGNHGVVNMNFAEL